MGVILDTILCAKNSLSGGSFEALTAQTPTTLSIRWLGSNTSVELLEAWGGDSATLCQFSIRSPLLHDNTRGIRFSNMFNPTLSGADGSPQLYLAPYWKQPYEPTDTLIVEANGTASDRVLFTQMLKYTSPDVSGARLISAPEVSARLKNIVGILVAPTGGTSGAFGTARAINADDDRLKANTDYALLGATSDLPGHTMTMFGPDTANFDIPLPLHWNEQLSAGWFYEMSRRWNEPLMPVINSNNKAVTQIRLADVANSLAPNICLQFAELSS